MMRNHRSAGIPFVAVAGLLVGLAWAPGARAATFVVNSNADDGIGCTFRLAVAAANGGTNGCGHGTASGDVVRRRGSVDHSVAVVILAVTSFGHRRARCLRCGGVRPSNRKVPDEPSARRGTRTPTSFETRS